LAGRKDPLYVREDLPRSWNEFALDFSIDGADLADELLG
jgi:hypothetical protein